MRALLQAFSLTLFGASVAFPTYANGGAGWTSAATHDKRQQSITFDPVKQRVDVSGVHRFIPPGPNDQRGPCPGLNAMANHGYIPRNGIVTFDQALSASQLALGLAPDSSLAVSTLGFVYGGNLVTQQLSIGGPVVVPPLLTRVPGLSGTHNKMEGDASPTRGDAYTNGGDASSVSIEHFKNLYNYIPEGGCLTFDDVVNHRVWTRQYSISTNPHFYSGVIPVVATSTLTHPLILRVFANRSLENPQGCLSREVLKSFFGVSGDGQNLVARKGYERIPDNWYKSSDSDQYNLARVVADIASMAVQHPEFLSVGGNTGTVNSFVGVDLDDLTGGVYNSANLFQGNNWICLVIQTIELGGISGLDLVQILKNALVQVLGPLNCPALTQYNTALLDQFPGAKDN